MTRAERLFFLLNDLDSGLVEEAAQPVPAARPRFQPHWARWGALCACLLLAVGLWNLTHLRMGSSSAAPGDGNGAPPAAAEGIDPAEEARSGDSYVGGDPESGGAELPMEAPSADAGNAYGTLIAEDAGPMDDQPYRLYYRESGGQWTLTHGEYAVDLTDQLSELSGVDSGELSHFIYFAVNGFLEDEFYPAEHVSFENYVLIAFGVKPGPSTCLVVGLNGDGSFDVDEALYLSRGE